MLSGPLSAIKQKSRSHWTFIFSLVIALLIFYFPWLFLQKSFYLSDATYYFEPLLHFIKHSNTQGIIPLWNPLSHCGMSQIAIPSPNIFYPFTFLFKIFSFSQALALFMVIHQLIAGLGMYMFISNLGWGRFSGAVAGIAFALSGYMFSLPYNFTLPATAAWIPFTLACLSKIESDWNRNTIRWIFAASLSIFMLCAAGRPELSVAAIALFSVFILLSKFWQKSETFEIKKIFFQYLAIGAGLLLASPIIWPALEWARLSPRAHGMDLKYVFLWSANWYDLLSMVLSQPFGNLSVIGSPYLPIAESRHSSLPYVGSTYLGTTIFTLAIWGLSDKTWKARVFVLLAFVLSLLMALGNSTPFAPFVVGLSSYLATFRYPIKLIIFPIFFISIMAARGLNLALTKNVGTFIQLLSIGLWALIVLFSATLLLSPHLNMLIANSPAFVSNSITLETLINAQKLLAIAGLCAGSIGIIICILYYLLLRSKLKPEAFGFIIIICAVIQVIGSSLLLQRPGTNDFFEKPSLPASEITQLIKQDIEKSGSNNCQFIQRFLPLYFDPLYCPPWLTKRKDISYEQIFYQYAHGMLLPNTHLDFNLPSSYGYEAAEVGGYKEMFTKTYRTCSQNKRVKKEEINDIPIANFCKVTATKYILAQAFRQNSSIPKLDPAFFQLIHEDIQQNFRLYTCQKTNPRIYFPNKIQYVTQEEHLSKVLAELSNNTSIETTFIEASELPFAMLSGKAEFIDDYPEKVVIKTNSECKGWIVLADQFYPGWKATIDAVPTQIYRANFFSRAVFVPAGEHMIQFTYEPASFYNALYAMLATLIIFAIAFISTKRRL